MSRSHTIVYSEAEIERLIALNGLVGLYLWVGLASITALVTIAHWIRCLEGYYRRRNAGFRQASTRRSSQYASTSNIDQRDVPQWAYSLYFLEAVWRKYSVKQFKVARHLFLGSVGQLLLIATYIGLNLGLMFGGTRRDPNWIAHHAAKLSYANLPLVIGLAGKNNILSLLTGFPYESLNVLHRWSARFLIATSAVHVGGRIWVNEPATQVGRRGSGYIVWGWVGFTLLTYMVVVASRTVRNRAYQFFLIQHVLLWFAIVPCLIIHRPRSQGWVWAGFGLQMLDRIGRTGRILFYHLVWPVHTKVEGGGEDQDLAWVTVLSEDTMRVTVRTRQNWIAGQHVYLHCYSESPGGHPFTISNTSRPLSQRDMVRPKETEQDLLIRVRSGMTRRIFDLGCSTLEQVDVERAPVVDLFPKARVAIRAWTEGPYGQQKHLGEDYNTLVLIAGGSGVSYTLAIALDLVRRARAMVEAGNQTKSVNIATKRVTFVWVIKRSDQIAWIDDRLNEICHVAPPDFLHIAIYVTSSRSPGELPSPVTHHESYLAPTSTLFAEPVVLDPTPIAPVRRATLHSNIQVIPGRPNFGLLIETEIEQSQRADWVGVGACGPTPMLNSIASAVRDAIQPASVLQGNLRRNVYFAAEEFGW